MTLVLKSTLTFILFSGLVYADTKTWTKSINFDDADNWDVQRAPCASDTVIIKEQTSVFLQTNGTLKEIILPTNGEVVLARDMQLFFSDDFKQDSGCPGQDVTFTRSNTESWLNPNNWNAGDSSIIIESDMIPCETDDVVFPTGKQFYVGIEKNVLSSTIRFGGQLLSSSSQVRSFLSSVGRDQFVMMNDASISLDGVPCGDRTGCICGNGDTETLDKICRYAATCPNLACQSPPKPHGSCCSICGGVLNIQYDSKSFVFQDLKSRMLADYIEKHNDGNRVRRQSVTTVSMYISKIQQETVQLIITDNGLGTENGKEASKLAMKINDDLTHATHNRQGTGIRTSHVDVSGSSEKSVAKSIGGGATAAIVISVIVTVVLVVSIVFVIFRRLPFLYRRDQPLDADIEMDKKGVEELPPLEEINIECDNPMYNNPIVKENIYADPTSQVNGVVDKGPVDDEDGVSNPMAITSY